MRLIQAAGRFATQSNTVLRLAIVAILLAMTVLVGQMSGGTASAASCTTQVQNPHYSVGAGGIIAKSSFTCTSGVTSYGYSLALYVCTSNPTGTDPASNAACTIKATNTNSFANPEPGKANILYVPPGNQSGVHGSGWWIATNRWTVNSGPYQKSFSQAMSITG